MSKRVPALSQERWLRRGLQLSVVTTGLWLGMVVTLALVAAPTLFAQLDRVTAGRLAGEMFRIEAHVALVAGGALLLLERWRLKRQSTSLSAELLLVAGALFCTVLGNFGLQPMMEAAKAGQAVRFSFAALHGASTAFFVLKGLLLLALLWRLAGR